MSVVEYEVLNIDFVNNVATIRPKSGGLKELQLLNVIDGLSVVDGPRDFFHGGDLSQYKPSTVTGCGISFDNEDRMSMRHYISAESKSLIIKETYELICKFDLFEAIDDCFFLEEPKYADLLKKHLLSAIERIDEIVNSTDEDEE